MLNGEFGDNRYNGIIEINDPNGKLRVNGLSVLKDKDSEFDLVLQARDLNVSALKLMPKYKKFQVRIQCSRQIYREQFGQRRRPLIYR